MLANRALVDVDVAIVGSGISGISAAYYVNKRAGIDNYTVIERRAEMGGTWDLFRYPGIRSDSDMYTFSFSFRPWCSAKRFGSGADIKSYLEETAKEFGIDRRMRLSTTVLGADWDSKERVWTLRLGRTHDEHRGIHPGQRPAADAPLIVAGSEYTLRARYLITGTGYYSYDKPHIPVFPGQDAFQGRIVLPQFWDPETPIEGKRVVVIGSGATAVTLVPAIAARGAKSVVMLQRTPSYLAAIPDTSPHFALGKRLAVVLPWAVAMVVTRWLHILESWVYFRLARRFPGFVKKQLAAGWLAALGSDLEAQKRHLTPPYNPWDQRVCAMPNADFLKTVKRREAEIVTDTIERFTETGVLLTSGRILEADVVIPATGLTLAPYGGLPITVDGKRGDNCDAYPYRSGAMMCDFPNFFTIMGYLNGSWALKSDLVATFAARVIAHAERVNAACVVPRCPAAERESAERVTGHFQSGYIQRAIAARKVPFHGSADPFRVHLDYFRDYRCLIFGSVTEKHLEYVPA